MDKRKLERAASISFRRLAQMKREAETTQDYTLVSVINLVLSYKIKGATYNPKPVRC